VEAAPVGEPRGQAPPSEEAGERVLRVAELNRIARLSLEERFPDVWVEGELTDVSRPGSGHVYFTLADAEVPSQIRGGRFRSDAQRAKASLTNGSRVRLRASLTIYEGRGQYQLIARAALPAGEGDRAAEVARMRAKLAAEGLMDPARKRTLPRFPRKIGLVTSRDGAALHDIVRVASARMGVEIVLAHCQVQGAEAPRSIVAALRGIQRVPGLDLVIIARGGGAAEDLSAYDDERVAREVAACRVPTVSGVGHEVDVSTVDLVADVRAATPSNAAEIAVPDARSVRAELDGLERALARSFDQRVQRERLRLERLGGRVGDPRRQLAAPRQRLAHALAALERSAGKRLAEPRRALEGLRARLAVHEPGVRLALDRERIDTLHARLLRTSGEPTTAGRQALENARARLQAAGRSATRPPRHALARMAGTLEALSPLGILARGYAIAMVDGRALISASDVNPGTEVALRLHRGTLEAIVQRVMPPREDPGP
jgi:exodeoxyribonuclease VII large subunit